MHGFKRSGRQRNAKSVTDYEDLVVIEKGSRKSSATKSQCSSLKKGEAEAFAKKHEESRVCCKCSLEFPSESSAKTCSWLQRGECDLWWHSVCSKLEEADVEKFEIYHINFTCAFCVLGIKATEAPTRHSYHTEDLSVLTKKVDQLSEVNLTQKEGSSTELNCDQKKEKG